MAKNIVFYFTGTGNSLSVANDIADQLGDAQRISISEALKSAPFDFTEKTVGFVFPSYYSCVPSIVGRFIKKANLSGARYIFGVVTFGGAYGMTLAQLSKAVAESGGVLNAGFSVRMPGNYIDNYGAFPHVVQRMMFKGKAKKIKKIVSVIKANGSTPIPKGSFILRNSEEKDHEILNGFGNAAKNFHASNACTGCGVCEKICPVDNIKLTDARPEWGNCCEHCVACIQWCPQKAIEYADKTAKRTRYHNPEVQLSDFLTALNKN